MQQKIARNKRARFLVSAMLVIFCLIMSPIKAQAIDQNNVTTKLNSLINQYNGSTWTNGSYGLGSQCYEFAHYIFNTLFSRGKVMVGNGATSSNTTNYKLNNVAGDIVTLGVLSPGYSASNLESLLESAAPGDYVQVRRTSSHNPHSMIVVDVDKSANKIRLFDANSDGKNSIKCYWQTFSDFANKNMGVSIYRYSGYTPGPTSPPANATISKSQVWYDLGDTIDITMYADYATGYYLSMFKDDQRIVSERVDSGHFTMAANRYGIGHYTAYCAGINSLGSVDSGWIDFDVVGEPGYSSISTTKKYYDLSDTVSISVAPICAKGQVIGIDKNGVQRVVTQDCGTTYTIAASSLGVGKYSAYFSVYNGSGAYDTQRVEFEIVDMLSDDALADLGFYEYVYIEHLSGATYLTNKQNEILAGKKQGGEDQIWQLIKAPNGAYRILNVLDGGYMTVENGQDKDGTKIIVQPNYTGETNQLFYIYYQCGAYYIRPLCSEERVLDMGSDGELELWDNGADWGPQEFNIIKIETQYTVSYDANGGTGAPAEQKKTEGVSLKLASGKPVKSYTLTYNPNGGTLAEKTKQLSAVFSEWNTVRDGTGDSYQPSTKYSTDKDLKLYALWENPKVGTLSVPTRSGYVFEGWYTSAEGGTEVTADTIVTKNLTVYAHWEKSVLPGDVNDDGAVNTRDSVLLRNHILDGTSINEEAADVNDDGKITTADSVLLRKYILGEDVELK